MIALYDRKYRGIEENLFQWQALHDFWQNRELLNCNYYFKIALNITNKYRKQDLGLGVTLTNNTLSKLT